jgi:hypothetical protein
MWASLSVSEMDPASGRVTTSWQPGFRNRKIYGPLYYDMAATADTAYVITMRPDARRHRNELHVSAYR